ncbi:hypothetical protein CDV36_004480 [Fusarium kuroshium]|uniref:Zn(2)-C6 fungal-type domain-containing protein n=1 Tax=Fusarium kuroshium TaxID=2010991 RepID=A0A3M2SEA3_9HYPO|nr:hypothetical protein CDV36_004480 [Fusarium kuroshium]
MSPHPPRKFRRIALKSPAEVSHYKRLSRPPRKLAAAKCDNCRKGKSKCVPQGHGCQRCLHKGLYCPGLTKPKRTKPGPSVSVEPSPSSTITTPLVIDKSSEAPVSAPSELSAEDVTFDSQSGEDDGSTLFTKTTLEAMETFQRDIYGLLQTIGPFKTISQYPQRTSTGVEESDALDELQGLDIALGLLDELVKGGEPNPQAEREASNPPAELCRCCQSSRSTMPPEPWKIGLVAYLEKLSPSESGSVACPCCSHTFGSQPDLVDIRSHLRDCLDAQRRTHPWRNPDRHLDRHLDRQNRDYELSKMISDFREHCENFLATHEQLQIVAQAQLPSAAQVQLPSATVFLTQLRVFCDGRLTCIGPKCQGVQFFDASWDDLVSHYEDYHAYHLLQDQDVIDLVDVRRHLGYHKRDIERLFDKARVRRDEWEFMDSHSRVMEELRCAYCLKCECSAHRRLPRSPQFDVLKDLNNAFRSRYQQFHRLAAESPSADLTSFLGEIREKCPTPKELRQLGTRIFKQVVQGTPPNTLLEIFAFISLSQAMTTVMRSRDIQIDSDPGTIDYLAWRTCIEDESSRRLYDEILITWFHPCWREELQSGGSAQTPLSVQEAMKRLVMQLMKAKETNEAFNFSAFLRLEPFPRKHANQGWTRTWWDENCEPAPSPVETPRNEEENDDPGGTDTRTLTNTVIFITASLFMIFIAALGVALLYLSNPEQRCYILSAAREEHVASVYDIVLATEMLKDRILNRLRQDSRLSALEDIVTAAEEALDGGYVWSVSDLHVQLEQAVQNHVEEPGLRSLLYTEIGRLCKEALNWVEPICERHRGGCMFMPVAV